MHSRLRALSVAVFAALASLATGCVVDNPLAYDACKTGKDCNSTYADTCVSIQQTWGSGTSYDAICTTSCTGDLGCSTSQNGLAGYCSDFSILGATAGTCFERCYYDTDCSVGFVCAGSKEVINLPTSELICVPEPTAPVYKAAYAPCTSNTQCDAATPYCVQLDPKWESTTDNFQMNICTDGCNQDSDCPLSGNGSAGYCAPADELSAGRVCVERCAGPSDCPAYFLCAYMDGIVGLPNTQDAICVPDPQY